MLVKPLFLVAVVVMLVLALFRLDQYLKIKALNDCGEFATYTTETMKKGPNGEDIKTTSREPIRNLYRTCVEDNGYKTMIAD